MSCQLRAAQSLRNAASRPTVSYSSVSLVRNVSKSVAPSKKPGRLFSKRLRDPEGGYQDFLTPSPVLDRYTASSEWDPRSGNAPRITYYNASPIFPRPTDADKVAANANSYKSSAAQEEDPEESSDDFRRPGYDRGDAPLIPMVHRHSYIIQRKLVSTQTGKGKIKSTYMGVVIGNGRGLVGFGEANGDGNEVLNKAADAAMRTADYVDLFEGRTIWTEMENKFGTSRIILRPRPRGFGLACNPHLHSVFKAAGIKDISAKVHGSRNPITVVKGVLQLLHSGGSPPGFGNGVGGKGRREETKQGIKSKSTMERERGRMFIEGGTWV